MVKSAGFADLSKGEDGMAAAVIEREDSAAPEPDDIQRTVEVRCSLYSKGSRC